MLLIAWEYAKLVLWFSSVSLFLLFLGPSYITGSACSSSLTALHQALHSIKQGECDMAIVAAAKVSLSPAYDKQFQKLGMLSNDGRCASFDEKGTVSL